MSTAGAADQAAGAVGLGDRRRVGEDQDVVAGDAAGGADLLRDGGRSFTGR